MGIVTTKVTFHILQWGVSCVLTSNKFQIAINIAIRFKTYFNQMPCD